MDLMDVLKASAGIPKDGSKPGALYGRDLSGPLQGILWEFMRRSDIAVELSALYIKLNSERMRLQDESEENAA